MNINTDELVLLKRDLKQGIDRIDDILLSLGKSAKVPDLSKEKQVEFVIDTVCAYGHIRKEDLVDIGHKAGLVEWRRIACYILSDYTLISSHAIKRALGYSSQVTALHHSKKLRTWMKEPRFAPKDTYMATLNLLNQLGYDGK